MDLKSLIKQHPELVKSKQALYSGLVDMYPNEKRAAKLIVIVYESGIAQKIAKVQQLDEITVRPLIKQLAEDYFIKEQYALDGIRYWAECFGKKLAYTIESSIQTAPIQKAPPTTTPKTVPIQQNIPNSNTPQQMASDNKEYHSETNDDTYYGIYKDMAYAKATNEDRFHRAFEIACSIVANLFLKNHEDFFDNHLMGARASFALVGLLGDETTKQEYSFISEKYFDNNFFTAAQILKPEIDEWIRESYHSDDMYALALDAVASFLTIKKFPDSYGETLMFIKELKNLESKGVSSYECGVIVAYIVLTTGQLESLFDNEFSSNQLSFNENEKNRIQDSNFDKEELVNYKSGRHNDEIYHFALTFLKIAKRKKDFYYAIQLLNPIKDFKKSGEIIEACNKMIEKLDLRTATESAKNTVKDKKTTVKKFCYSFNEGNAFMRNLLGGKGADLAEMTNIGLSVPQGFIITTEACNQFYEDGKTINERIWSEVTEHIKMMEISNGKKLGDINNPLFVSVRSGARTSMPGLMDTILNLGFNDNIASAMISFNPDPAFKRFVYDSYRRFIQTFSVAVMGFEDNEIFNQLINEMKEKRGVRSDVELDSADLKELATQFKAEYKNQLGKDFPSDPVEQLKLAIEAVFRSWDNSRVDAYRRDNDIPYSWGTAVNVMPMVFGNLNNQSGTGVAFTRDPATGEKKLMGEFLINAQGEDVVEGVRTPMSIAQMEQEFPEVYAEFIKVCDILENHYHDMQDIEFTVENNKLYMLQCRNGKRTAQAAIRIVCDLVDEGHKSEKEAVMMIDSQTIITLSKPEFDPDELQLATQIGRGLGTSSGVAYGKVVFTSDDAVSRNSMGEKVIFVCTDITPKDVCGIKASQGILCYGDYSSNAAVTARHLDICCVSCYSKFSVDEANKKLVIGEKSIFEGDYISIDGLSGNIYDGIVHTRMIISNELKRVMEWIDKYEVKN